MADPIRIQKFLSEQGVCSRREADAAILAGEVRLNGKIAQPGDKLDPAQDALFFRNRRILARHEPALTLVMNKPRGFLCSHDDPHHDRTVFDLLPTRLRQKRLFIAGRLDKESEGLLILTSDGDLAHRLTHPSQSVTKRYRVRLNRRFDPADIQALLAGRTIEGEFLRADRVIPETSRKSDGTRLEVHLGHGRKREIRRLLEASGYFVKRLRRFQIGSFVLRNLSPGSSRELAAHEIELLFRDPAAR